MKRIHKYGSLLMVLALGFNLGGYQITFRVRQHIIRTEMRRLIREGIPDSELTVIIVDTRSDRDTDQLKWMNEDELSYHGRMYDVVRRQQSGNEMRLYCLCDENESELIAERTSWLQHQNGNSSTENNLLRLLVKVLPMPVNGYEWRSAAGNIISYPDRKDQLQEGIIQTSTPPPRVAV